MKFTRFLAWYHTGNPFKLILRTVWIFFFLLINRKEGKELVNDLLNKMIDYDKRLTKYHEDVGLWFKENTKKYDQYILQLEQANSKRKNELSQNYP